MLGGLARAVAPHQDNREMAARIQSLADGGDRTVEFLTRRLLDPQIGHADEDEINRLAAPLADPVASTRVDGGAVSPVSKGFRLASQTRSAILPELRNQPETLLDGPGILVVFAWDTLFGLHLVGALTLTRGMGCLIGKRVLHGLFRLDRLIGLRRIADGGVRRFPGLGGHCKAPASSEFTHQYTFRHALADRSHAANRIPRNAIVIGFLAQGGVAGGFRSEGLKPTLAKGIVDQFGTAVHSQLVEARALWISIVLTLRSSCSRDFAIDVPARAA